MNTLSTSLALLAATAMTVVATAQTQGQTSAATPTAFAATVAQDGMTDVALAGLVLQKSHNDQVRQFAQKIVHERAQSNLELQSIVEREGLILPTQLAAKYQALVSSLNVKSGGAFDRAYLEHAAKGHAAAIALFESASTSNDPDMAAFAQKTLSTLQQDGQLADNLRASAEIRIADAR